MSGADELPAVTQLFTEDYMVLFLLHNTLGAWWAGKVLADNPSLASSGSMTVCLIMHQQNCNHMHTYRIHEPVEHMV